MTKKSVMTAEHVGEKEFPRCIDITDPCYNKDVWCRMNNVEIKPGTYRCVAWMSDEGDWGMRCMTAGIYHASVDKPVNSIINRQNEELIGEIGVDTGLAGFFADKPDYDDGEWADFCNNVRNGNAWILDEGFCTSSGYGDGGYDVYAARNDEGEIIALEIRFYD